MIARLLSMVFHPFVMIGVLAGVAAAARQPAGEALGTVAIVLVFTVVPLLVLMVRQVRRGAWDNVDASNRRERPVLYLAGIVLVVALLVATTLFDRPSFLFKGVLGTLGLLGTCAAATRWTKVSLHMAFATFAAVLLALMRSPIGILVALGLPALAWSRLALERHSIGEIALGCVIGAAAAGVTHYL